MFDYRQIFSKNAQSKLESIFKLPRSEEPELLEPYKSVYGFWRPFFDKAGSYAACELEKHIPEQPITTEYNKSYATKQVTSPLPLIDGQNQGSEIQDTEQFLNISYLPSLPSGEVRPTIVWVHGGAWFSGSKALIEN